MLPSIFDYCQPRPEIQAGELTSEIFAAKIRPVVEGNAPPAYQQPTALTTISTNPPANSQNIIKNSITLGKRKAIKTPVSTMIFDLILDLIFLDIEHYGIDLLGHYRGSQ
ncbi:hypothetical protein VB712_16200 [Spirulina sp. CCNP1310]|uniref:hypothetical protein n=1 Tax=Spirulina sp. CCNP1310 TaxID=3110249 RepID=UPI002B2144B2|nr:hypothetical protein [Spirulina sp. CCNP1310]MEA5420775.1 hypothetical protein [Spirulina sp. CCNP1310]